MRSRFLLSAVLAIAPVLPAAAEPKPVEVSLALSPAALPLGGIVQAEITVRNPGAEPRTIPEVRFETRSVSFALSFRTASGSDRTAEHHVIVPDCFTGPRFDAPQVVLPPGAAVVQRFAFPAVRVGPMRVRAKIGDLASNEAALEVRPADGKSKLAAEVETSKGTFVVEFLPDAAMNSVMNFVNLARARFYEKIVFHRVIKDFVIQAGNPALSAANGFGTDGPGYTIRAEISDEKHAEGSVAMARVSANKDSAGSQFYVCLAPQPKLDGKYTVFGRVADGMDVVRAIGSAETNRQTDRPLQDVIIQAVRIVAR